MQHVFGVAHPQVAKDVEYVCQPWHGDVQGHPVEVQALVGVQQPGALDAGEVSLDDRPRVVEPLPVEAVTVDGADGAQELAFRFLGVFEVASVGPVRLVLEVASFPVAGEPVIAVGVGSQELHGLAAGAGWQAVVDVDAVVETFLPGFWSTGSLIRGMVACVPWVLAALWFFVESYPLSPMMFLKGNLECSFLRLSRTALKWGDSFSWRCG